jgi:hypothetical protein
MTTVRSRPRDESASWMDCSVSVSSDDVASSSSTMGASFSRQRAIATRCFSPPLSFNPRSPTWWLKGEERGYYTGCIGTCRGVSRARLGSAHLGVEAVGEAGDEAVQLREAYDLRHAPRGRVHVAVATQDTKMHA